MPSNRVVTRIPVWKCESLHPLDQPAFEVTGFGVEGGADQEQFATVGGVFLVVTALVDLLKRFFRRALQLEFEHEDPRRRLDHGVDRGSRCVLHRPRSQNRRVAGGIGCGYVPIGLFDS
jgi:hypothetical protein